MYYCHKEPLLVFNIHNIHIFINLLFTSIFESQTPAPKKAQAHMRTHHMNAAIVGFEAGQA